MAGWLRGRPALGHALAVGLAAWALAARLAVGDALPPGFPFLTFFPAILITGYVAGFRPGLLALLLALASVWYFLLTPPRQLALSPGNAMALGFFLIVGLVDLVIIEAMHRAVDKLRIERRRNRDLYEQQRTLFQELQHRVANNLAFIAGLLRLQKRRIAADPAATPVVFDEAVARIDTMGRIHRRLYDPGEADAAIGAHLEAVCTELLSAMGADGVAVRVEVPGLKVPLDRLLPLSLLVAEIITNSVKHGFAGRADGEIRITSEADGDGQALVIRDDGTGLVALPDAASPGLGMRIVQGLAAQLGGSVSWSSDAGTVTRVTLPAI
ncbi:hypothetical protein IP88_15925 [alpha proteobacterium AAP81b]|nr:hypothetical protein IP88_15925 [alpha proteobacterium AAP81b]